MAAGTTTGGSGAGNDPAGLGAVRRALGYLRSYRLEAGGAFVALVLVTGANLVTPLLIGRAIDDGIRPGRPDVLLALVAGLVGVALARGLFTFLQGYLAERASQGVAYDLRNALFERIGRLSFSYYDRVQTGQLVTRLTNDVEQIRTFTGSGVVQLGNAQLISQLYTQLQSGLAGAERIYNILDEEPEPPDPPAAERLGRIRGEISFESVTFAYEPGRPVLRDVTFEVTPGQTVALVGPTGAGKTTIASLIPRFYDATEGAVRIDGRDVRALSRKDLRAGIGIVLQEPFLFSGTIAENIGYGKDNAAREEIERAARTVNSHGFITDLPDGYNTVLGEVGGSLSQGQRQLLSFARAVLTDPRILILDEATSNIDTRTEAIIQRALGTLLEGRTSVVIAHRLSTIRNANMILAVRDGRIVERGTHRELLEKGGLYADLYRRQFREPVTPR